MYNKKYLYFRAGQIVRPRGGTRQARIVKLTYTKVILQDLDSGVSFKLDIRLLDNAVLIRRAI